MFSILKKQFDLKQLQSLAKDIAEKSNIGDLFLLKGQLGAGKTTFARFFINSIYNKYSLKKPLSIKSPSFPIMINYPVNDFEVFHYDLYRLNAASELIELNIIENINKNITLIEWPELILKSVVIKNYILIKLKIINNDKREIQIYYNKIENL